MYLGNAGSTDNKNSYDFLEMKTFIDLDFMSHNTLVKFTQDQEQIFFFCDYSTQKHIEMI